MNILITCKLKNEVMTSTLIKKVATKFSLSESQLVERGLKAFLQEQLYVFDAELRTIFARHAVRSLQEFDRLMTEQPHNESNLLPDFQRADYLTTRIAEIAAWIKVLNGHG